MPPYLKRQQPDAKLQVVLKPAGRTVGKRPCVHFAVRAGRAQQLKPKLPLHPKSRRQLPLKHKDAHRQVRPAAPHNRRIPDEQLQQVAKLANLLKLKKQRVQQPAVTKPRKVPPFRVVNVLHQDVVQRVARPLQHFERCEKVRVAKPLPLDVPNLH